MDDFLAKSPETMSHEIGVSTLNSNVEKQLVAAMIVGLPDQYEEELNGLENVNANIIGHGTLLHEAVKVGSVAWVGRLLVKGADPNVKDNNQLTALQLADLLSSMHPGNEDRKAILKWVRSICRKVPAKQGDPSGQESAFCEEAGFTSRHDCITVLHSLEALLSQVSDNVTSVKLSLDLEVKTFVLSLSEHLDSTLKSIGNMKTDLISSKESINDLKNDLNLIISNTEDLKNDNKELSEELSFLKRDLTRELESLKATIEELKNGLNMEEIPNPLFEKLSFLKSSLRPESESRDNGLEDLKAADDSLAREISPITESMNELREHQKKFPARIRLGFLLTKFEENVRSQTVEDMMLMTEILDKDDSKVSRVRGLYEELYSLSPLTSILLKCLRFQPEVRVHIDCDSEYIGRMKKTFIDFDGLVKECGGRRDIADFEEKRVYLGALYDESRGKEYILGFMAFSLCCMSMYSTYKNGGRPYFEGDEEWKRRYLQIIEEAEGRRKEEFSKPAEDLGNTINWALDKETRIEREVYLIATVPKLIASEGLAEGTSLLRSNLPSILEFYEDQVVTTLTKDFESHLVALE